MIQMPRYAFQRSAQRIRNRQPGGRHELGGSRKGTESGRAGERKTIHIVLHEAKDTVGVAVVEGIKAGSQLNAWIMDEDEIVTFPAKQDIPIGHKAVLKDMKVGVTRCSSTAWISARWCRRSVRASTRTCTTSRRSAGKPLQSSTPSSPHRERHHECDSTGHHFPRLSS